MNLRKDSQVRNIATLSNGVKIPLVGFGTGGLPKKQSAKAIREALRTGYRLLDSAAEYKNEEIITEVLKMEKVPRHEVFLTSKVWPTDLGFNETLQTAYNSLKLFNTSYIDLYLIHWPFCFESVSWMHCGDKKNKNGTWEHSWAAMEALYNEGYFRSIGVSNFDNDLLKKHLRSEKMNPHVVQNFMDPLHQDESVVNQCQTSKIFYQSYATLRNVMKEQPRTSSYWNLQQDLEMVVSEYFQAARTLDADRKGILAAQVVLRYFVGNGIGVIPRSTNQAHIHSNYKIFDLSVDPEFWETIDRLFQVRQA
jgi:diketogulonate reductase-like aldo/keto reductase